MTKHYLTQLIKICVFAFLFSAFQAEAATINGRVWMDANTNGIQDAGETSMSNVWVSLEANGSQVTGMYTNASGQYSFTGVANGTYRLKFANPGGLFQTRMDMGTNDNVDNDADQYGYTETFSVSGTQTKTYDAGFTATAFGCFTPITISITNKVCDNKNNTNPNDDTWTFQLTATGGTGPWGWDLPAQNIMMHPYGQPRTFGPYLISNGNVSLTIIDHDNMDCDASVTVTPPACPPPPVLTLTCPPDLTVYTNPGQNDFATVNYAAPVATSTCTVGSVTVTRTQGPASGGQFPVGVNTVCFRAEDGCGNTKTCCFKVTTLIPCDTKICATTGSSIIFDLLTVVSEPNKEKTYCMRVTNLGSTPLMYVAFQLPNGVTAVSPANNSLYTAPSGNEYEVRNPNFSPFYSIRFKTPNGIEGIKSGQSDIFKYTLPQQVNPWYIHAITRVSPKVFCEVHLTTADCMPQINPNTFQNDKAVSDDDYAVEERGGQTNTTAFGIAPNPADQYVFADLSAWDGQDVQVRLFNTAGQVVRSVNITASTDPLQIELATVPAGIYHLQVIAADVRPDVKRIVIKH